LYPQAMAFIIMKCNELYGEIAAFIKSI
jgi:hypothetical protein